MGEEFLPLEVERLSIYTGNIYKSVRVCGMRANQLTITIKEELSKKLAEFAPAHDNLEEVVENREQIEISKFYERKPKPVQNALHAFLDEEVYFRNSMDPTDTNAPELAPGGEG